MIDTETLVPSSSQAAEPVRKPRHTASEKSNTQRERPQRARNKQRDNQPAQPASGNANSFHEGNLPAFLQRPVRPQKPAKNASRSQREVPPAEVDG